MLCQWAYVYAHIHCLTQNFTAWILYDYTHYYQPEGRQRDVLPSRIDQNHFLFPLHRLSPSHSHTHALIAASFLENRQNVIPVNVLEWNGKYWCNNNNGLKEPYVYLLHICVSKHIIIISMFPIIITIIEALPNLTWKLRIDSPFVKIHWKFKPKCFLAPSQPAYNPISL